MRIGHRKSQAPLFNPRQLFKGSEVGGWWDARDLSTMFTDTGATTPVTADGNNVKCWNDKSGRGNHVTEATNCPIYKADMGGCVRFDGSNDILSKTSSLGGMWDQPGCSSFAALKTTSAAVDDRLWGERHSVNTPPIYAPLQMHSSTPSSVSSLFRNDTNATFLASSTALQANFWTGEPEVIGSVVDQGLVIPIVYTYLNGIPRTALPFTGAKSGTLIVDRFAIGAMLGASAGSFMAVDICELIIIGRVITESERLAVMRYLGRPRGVYF